MKKSLFLILIAVVFSSVTSSATVQPSDLKELQKCQADKKHPKNKALDDLLAGPCKGQSTKLTANCQEALVAFKNKNHTCCKYYSKGSC